MGEGGYLQLVNGTEYTWRREGDPYSYQLHSFGVPESVRPGSTDTTYIEYKQSLGTTRSDTEGKVTYVLEGTSYRIKIYVSDDPANIQVYLDFPTTSLPRAEWVDLGWQHDGVTRFILSGKETSATTQPELSASHPPINWMSANLRTLGKRPLSQICMPGTHDSGMSQTNSRADLLDIVKDNLLEGFTITQDLSIYPQLLRGVRYFDIRPVIGSGVFFTGHYSEIASHWIGSRGEIIEDIVQGINRFTENNKELIILNVSHARDSDSGFTRFNNEQWQRFCHEMSYIKDLFHIDGSARVDLTGRTLDSFIGSGRAAVLVTHDRQELSLGDFEGKGFFHPSCFNINDDDYSNTDDCNQMRRAQLDLLEKRDAGKKQCLFLLAWTLTQQTGPMPKPIRTLANSANKALFEDVLEAATPQRFPNILSVDYLDSSDFAALAMAINDKCFTIGKPQYLSGLHPYLTENAGDRPVNVVREISDGNNDVNAGFGGRYSYLACEYGFDPAKAVSWIQVAVEDSERDSSWTDMAKGAKGAYRYIECLHQEGYPNITNVAMMRSDHALGSNDAQAKGFRHISSDLNEGRGGDYLYLVWR